MPSSDYIELHARSAFSFLRGGSLPEKLAETAGQLGLGALGLCDRMGVYGAPRLMSTAKEVGVRPIFGTELAMDDGSVVPVLVANRTGYNHLCELLTRAHLRAPKGEGVVRWHELPEFAEGLVALTGDKEGPLARGLCGVAPASRGSFAASRRELDGITGVHHLHDLRRDAEGDPRDAGATGILANLVRVFGPKNVFVEIQRHYQRGEERLNRALIDLARAHGLPLLATNGVMHATPEGRQIADVFTCLRNHTTLDGAGTLLSVNAERHLKTAAQMQSLFADLPDAITNTARLADRLRFELTDLGYEFPKFPVGPGETMEGVLRERAYAGARDRYHGEVPEKIRALLEKELALINELGFAGYFLLVWDIVRFCRSEGIMVQGRGSAANSAVCFCLGITAVDPVKFNVLFERFLTRARKAWPDIDLDLPSGDRRERVIQEVFRRYGPHGAAMTGTVITYRGRSVARELGKVLGLPVDILDRFSSLFASGDFPHTVQLFDQMEQAGLSRAHPRAPAFATLYQQMARLPRHLGQHSGGMIICQGKLNRFVPLENAAMPGRVVAQWDKDDCEDLGIIKVDLLGLGMMSALQDTVTLCAQRGRPVDLAQLPQDDASTFAMMQRADTIGVFQIESRAQMATLPRMKPTCFYDVVIEVAIIRPGPIQGDLAHPFLRRRCGEEEITYYAPQLKPVLERTLGVPLFQEQMLEIAQVMAKFSGEEAEDLRRAMSFHRSDERMNSAVAKLRGAMDGCNVAPGVAEAIVRAVGSFALYGFPESHAISFAHLAYASTYLKVHRAVEFYCALLNNQPMGFYSPATLVKDAKRHGVQVRPVCVLRSDWDCVIEADGSIRLGLRQVQGLRRDHAEKLLQARAASAFRSLEDFKTRTRFTADELRTLAEIGALNQLSTHRRAALWEVERAVREDEFSFGDAGAAVSSPLRPMDDFERVQADFSSLALTTGPHPMALVRPKLTDHWTAAALSGARDGERVRVAGMVICRQRPGTAKGVVFVSLEDETGIANVIVAAKFFEAHRLVITSEGFLSFAGPVQYRHGTIHVRAEKVDWLDVTELQAGVSHDFH